MCFFEFEVAKLRLKNYIIKFFLKKLKKICILQKNIYLCGVK